jgi:hypothetical protein
MSAKTSVKPMTLEGDAQKHLLWYHEKVDAGTVFVVTRKVEIAKRDSVSPSEYEVTLSIGMDGTSITLESSQYGMAERFADILAALEPCVGFDAVLMKAPAPPLQILRCLHSLEKISDADIIEAAEMWLKETP